MKWRPESSITLPAPGFIEPCIPSPAKKVPRGADWIFELKHDGYRLMVRKAGVDVRIYSRRGADFTGRYPLLVAAMRRLRATSALLDGEGVVYDQNGMPSFDLIHSKEYNREVSLVAFDLLEKDGEDLRPQPLLERKRRLAHLLKPIKGGIELNEYLEGDGADIFRAACHLVTKASSPNGGIHPTRAGDRCDVKIKNPDSAAAKRLEDGSF